MKFHIYRMASFILASAAFIPIWVRSYSTYDDLHYTFGGSNALTSVAVDAASIEGVIFLSVITFQDHLPGRNRGMEYSASSGKSRLWSWPLATFGQYADHGRMWNSFGAISAKNIATSNGIEAIRGIAIPHWFASVLLMSLPAIRFVKVFRRFRLARTDRCAACGYDLRATPGQCPECGTASQQKSQITNS